MEQLFLETLSQTFHEEQKLLTINASLNKQYTFSKEETDTEREMGRGTKKRLQKRKTNFTVPGLYPRAEDQECGGELWEAGRESLQ